jgi:hypothetical protein
MVRTETVTLVIGADRSVRVGKRPRIQPWEVAVRLHLHFPDSWGRTIGSLDITVPDFATELRYEQVEEVNHG